MIVGQGLVPISRVVSWVGALKAQRKGSEAEVDIDGVDEFAIINGWPSWKNSA
jgi:hypothetical protein